MNTIPKMRDWHEIRLDRRVPIVVATRNLDKYREIETLWGSFLPAVAIGGERYPDVKETGNTYEENAILKAAALADIVGGAALADDSGIEVKAMGWGPGVRSARTPSVNASSAERNENILRAVAGHDRAARFVSVCALVVPGFEPVLGRGVVLGSIAERPVGSNGFGYDPIFWYPQYGKTFAQVDATHKNSVSHRGRAVRALHAKLARLLVS